jgi:hypothetical protein
LGVHATDVANLLPKPLQKRSLGTRTSKKTQGTKTLKKTQGTRTSKTQGTHFSIGTGHARTIRKRRRKRMQKVKATSLD